MSWVELSRVVYVVVGGTGSDTIRMRFGETFYCILYEVYVVET